MVSNVFGEPITEGSRSERAAKASSDINENGKRDAAVNYVRDQNEKFGHEISTQCIFYNATGVTLKKCSDNDYAGDVFDTYPQEVQNGQWGAFLHGNNASTATASKAYVAYRVEGNGGFCCTLIGWKTHKVDNKNPNANNHAFCGIYNDGAIPNNDTIAEKINGSKKEKTCEDKGISMDAKIDVGSSQPLFQAFFKLNLDKAC